MFSYGGRIAITPCIIGMETISIMFMLGSWSPMSMMVI